MLHHGAWPVRPIGHAQGHEPQALLHAQRVQTALQDVAHAVGGIQRIAQLAQPVGLTQLGRQGRHPRLRPRGPRRRQLDGQWQPAQRLDDLARRSRIARRVPLPAPVGVALGEEYAGGLWIEHVQRQETQQRRRGLVARGRQHGDAQRRQRLQRATHRQIALDIVQQHERRRGCRPVPTWLEVGPQRLLAQLHRRFGCRRATKRLRRKGDVPGREHLVLDPGQPVETGAAVAAHEGDASRKGARLRRQHVQGLGRQRRFADPSHARHRRGETHALPMPERVE